MIPVFQERSNDCLPACLASILELPLGCVPNYAGRAVDFDDQTRRHQRWLRGIGWTLLECPLRWQKRPRRLVVPWGPMATPVWCIVTAKVGPKRSDVHALVGRIERGDLSIAHDPSPRPWENPKPLAVGFLVPAIRHGEGVKRLASYVPNVLPMAPPR